MQRQSINFRLLTAAFVLLSIGSYPVVGVGHLEANSTVGPNPVASFHFINIKKLGEDAISHDKKIAIIGKVRQVDSPFGCAAEFDGKGRISASADNFLNINHSFSTTAWVNGSGARFMTLERAGMRGSNFQVVGDKIYFVTNSDPPKDSSSPPAKGLRYYRSAIWSGVADVNLGSWDDKLRTKFPLNGLEPKVQVVGGRLFFEYFGGDADGNWQIYTGSSETDGSDWSVRQRTFQKMGYAAEQSLNIQVVGNKVYYAFPLKDKSGKWQLWTATSDINGSSWKALQQPTKGGFVPSFRVSGDKIYYIFLSGVAKEKVRGDFKNDVIIASSNLDGSGWREIHRIHDAAWLIAHLTVDKDTIYYLFSKRDSSGNAHLWTGSVSTDGSHPQELQRTFGTGNAAPVGGVQVVGDKVLYAFSATKQPVASMFKVGSMGMSFWTASTNLDGGNWIQQREIGGDGDDYGAGYKMLAVGGKHYYDLTRLHYMKNKGNTVRYEAAILAYSGSNILNKGDSYGIGMSASGSVSGFVNAGEDYLHRGEAPEDTAGALVEQRLAPGWHHVAVTYDGDTLRLYVDGKLARETRYDKKPAANPFPLSIGDGFVGKIADVMLFDRALNQSEISALADRHDKTTCKLAPQ